MSEQKTWITRTALNSNFWRGIKYHGLKWRTIIIRGIIIIIIIRRRNWYNYQDWKYRGRIGLNYNERWKQTNKWIEWKSEFNWIRRRLHRRKWKRNAKVRIINTICR